MSKENEIFVKYGTNKSVFFDIGAAEGYFSALFASINQTPCKIYSIDCGASSIHKHLYLTRDINSRFYPQHEWEIIYAYISSASEEEYRPEWLDKDCPILTIKELSQKTESVPDFIKMDIESFEYEAIKGSIDFLQEHKPTIILELHNEILKSREINGKDIIELLKSIGYNVAESDCKNYLAARGPHIVLI